MISHQEAERLAMEYANERRPFGVETLFDFGELGILRLYWYKMRWVMRWYDRRMEYIDAREWTFEGGGGHVPSI